MYVPVSLPLPCFQTALARSSASAWLCCCSSSTSCFLGSPLIFIFLLAGLHLSSPPSAAVSGHQWVSFRWKSFKKGLCGNTYSSCLDILAPAYILGQVLPWPGCPAAAPAGWFPPCHPSSERFCFCCGGWSWQKACLPPRPVVSKWWRGHCAPDLFGVVLLTVGRHSPECPASAGSTLPTLTVS